MVWIAVLAVDCSTGHLYLWGENLMMGNTGEEKRISVLETAIRRLVDHLSQLSLEEQLSILAKGGEYDVVNELERRLGLQRQDVLE